MKPILCNVCGKPHPDCDCEPAEGMNCLGCNQVFDGQWWCSEPNCRFYEPSMENSRADH